MEYLIIGLLLGYIASTNLKFKRKPKIDPLVQEKLDKANEHFMGLMNYDAKQAYGGRR